MAEYYPVFLNVRGKSCIVVGAGPVARRKVAALLDTGADVTMVAPDADWPDGAVRIINTGYTARHLEGAFLVFAATGDGELNHRIAIDASRAGALANAADDAENSDFILGALMRRGSVCVAVSTSGASPALARSIRERMSKVVGEEYGAFAAILMHLRERVLGAIEPGVRRHELLAELADEKYLDVVRTKGADAARAEMEALIKRAENSDKAG